MVDTRFYHFRQNNSGGDFHIDDERGIGVSVYIEAANGADAIYKAEQLGIYFDGVSAGRDCPCCGDRWSEPWSDKVDGYTVVETVTPDPDYSFTWHDTVYVHRLDGSLERVKKSEAA